MAETNDARDTRLDAVHARAMERFDRAYAAQREMRLQCMQDRRFVFVPGAQYDGDLQEQFANRPRFEINKVHQSVIRIFSEYRNNRVTVDFRPDDEDTSEDTADFMDGLYRADEQDSGGQEAYDTAFEEGVAGGMGAWRLRNRYEDEQDEDDDRQRIDLVPIPDADQSVFFDANAKRYDKSDARCAWVITGLQDSDYDDAYGDSEADTGEASTARGDWDLRRATQGEEVASFDKVTRTGIFDWCQPEVIYVAEYYEVETVTEPVNYYRQRASGEEQKLKPKDFESKDEFLAAEKDLTDQGFVLSRVKKVKRRKVHKYIIDGCRVLEDSGYIAGCEIPIIPFYAKRQYVDNVERVGGQVRLAIDLQRLYNMLVSLLAYLSVQSPVSKPILTPSQIAGHEKMWSRDTIDNFPYLLLNAAVGPDGTEQPAQPLAYTKAPEIPQALAGLLTLIGIDLKEVLGESDSAQEVVSNISAKAVELIQNRLDMQNFIYMDNFKSSMKRCAEVWRSMAGDLYVEDDRPMRVVNTDGTDQIKKLRQETVGEDQSTSYLNDPTTGKYKVVADVGPSFTTRRDGTVRAVTGMMQFVDDPNDKAVLAGVAIQNLEGEGLQDVKKYWRHRMILMGVTEPTEEEAKQIEQAQSGQQQPDANSLFLLASAKKADADAQKSQANAQLLLQQINESQANIAGILAKIDTGRLDALLQLAESMKPEPAASAAQPA
jgi:hypothetical protein